MKEVKGIAKIEFFDKNGEKVKEINEKNLITNSLQNILDSCNLICKNPLSLNGSRNIDTIGSLSKIENYIGGLLLFEDKITEDPNITSHSKISVASAGSKHDLSNPLRGSLNEQESGVTNIEDKAAYRWVWDFGTANANCTFNTLCLTTRRTGDRDTIANKFSYSSDFYENRRYFEFISARGNTITNSGQLVTVDGQNNSIIKIEKRNSISIKDNLKDIIEKKIYTLNDYTNFSSSHFYEDNNLRFVAKKISDKKNYLLSVDVDSLEIINEIELVGTVMNSYVTFSLVEDNLLYNYRLSGNALFASAYNMTTKTIESDIKVSDLYTTSSFLLDYNPEYFQRISTIKANGKYQTYIFCSRNSNGDSKLIYYIYCYIYSMDNIISFSSYAHANSGFGGRYSVPLVSFDVNKDVSLWFQFNNGSNIGDEAVPFLNNYEPLFTINALASPVTKTEANTMKITYTLIYD